MAEPVFEEAQARALSAHLEVVGKAGKQVAHNNTLSRWLISTTRKTLVKSRLIVYSGFPNRNGSYVGLPEEQ
jgi:hypothetical protein